MFGYVQPYRPDLRVREFEEYKAVYCSLCKELGRSFGLFAKFTLSYDMTFLAMLKMSLREGECAYVPGRCSFNPMKKCGKYEKGHPDIVFAAKAAMIMTRYKLQDDIADHKGFRRFVSRLLSWVFGSPCRKASKAYPQLDEIVRSQMAQQARLEEAQATDMDEAADPTAQMLSALAESCGETVQDKRVLNRLGYCLGRWIYFMDAADDLEKDRDSGQYNVFLLNPKSGDELKEILNCCAVECAKCLALLQVYHFYPILENILTDGLYQMQLKVLSQKK